MRNRINNILIGLLWLLAVILGASFWFNTKYGFNIFSVQHWQYLAYMQASNQPVKTSFYISLLVIVVVAVFGLYQLLQPRIRRIILPIFDKSTTPNTYSRQNDQTGTQNIDALQKQVTTTQPVTQTVKPEKPTSNPSVSPARPPRLNIPTIKQRDTVPVARVPLTSSPMATRQDLILENDSIREIFASNGFVIKGSPRIKGLQTSVIAIGTNEILWIGANRVSTIDMQRTIDTLRGVFTDTLEDIEIDIHAFIIDPIDNTNNESVIHFASVDDLRTYIDAHPNAPLADDEIENFDAYSAYIGTVVDYIGKI